VWRCGGVEVWRIIREFVPTGRDGNFKMALRQLKTITSAFFRRLTLVLL
jgi:hypothetical protein